jgi:hypothetical protein
VLKSSSQHSVRAIWKVTVLDVLILAEVILAVFILAVLSYDLSKATQHW